MERPFFLRKLLVVSSAGCALRANAAAAGSVGGQAPWSMDCAFDAVTMAGRSSACHGRPSSRRPIIGVVRRIDGERGAISSRRRPRFCDYPATIPIDQGPVRRHKRKKAPVGERQPLQRPTRANKVWAMDFVFDRTAGDGVIKCVVIVGGAMHKPAAIDVERAMSGHVGSGIGWRSV